MPFNKDGTRKPNLIVDTEKLKKGQRRLVEGIANANQPKMGHGPDLYMPKAGPFMMKPGNDGSIGSANNTQGSFRADSSAEAFAANMPRYDLPKNTGERSGSTIQYNPDGSVKVTGRRRRGSQGRIYTTERLPGETAAQYRDRIQAESAEYYGSGAGRSVSQRNLSSGQSKRSGKPNMHGPKQTNERSRRSGLSPSSTDILPAGEPTQPHSRYAELGYMKAHRQEETGDYIAVDGSAHKTSAEERAASAKALEKAQKIMKRKRSGVTPNMTKPLYGVQPMFFKKNKKK